MSGLMVCAALGIEARALRKEGLWVERVGMGVRRAEEFARRGTELEFDVLAVAGFGGATDGCLRAGDVVVADEVRRGGAVVECGWADSVAFALERDLILEPEAEAGVGPFDSGAGGGGARVGSGSGSGSRVGSGSGSGAGSRVGSGSGSGSGSGFLRGPHTLHSLRAGNLADRLPAVVTGPIETVDHVASVETLTRLAGEGVTTVDMESFPLVATARGRPFVVVRVIVDTPEHPLIRPSTLRAGLIARKRLQAVGAVLRSWAAALERV